MWPSWKFLEKNVLLDAVIGVEGVLEMMRDAGGLRFRSDWRCSCRAATLAAVEGFRGPTVMGGRRKPAGCLFAWVRADFFSVSGTAAVVDFRVLAFRLTFPLASVPEGMEKLPVELL